MSQQMTIKYEDDLLATLGLSPRDFANHAKFLLAAKLGDERQKGDQHTQFLTQLGELKCRAPQVTESQPL